MGFVSNASGIDHAVPDLTPYFAGETVVSPFFYELAAHKLQD